MAIEKRISAKLRDVEIVFLCKDKACEARIGFDLKNWNAAVPYNCENCKIPGSAAVGNEEKKREARKLIENLKSALKMAINAERDLPFEMRIEFTDRPESKP